MLKTAEPHLFGELKTKIAIFVVVVVVVVVFVVVLISSLSLSNILQTNGQLCIILE